MSKGRLRNLSNTIITKINSEPPLDFIYFCLYLSFSQILIHFIIKKRIFNWCICRDMISNRHKETRTLFTNIHTSFHFPVNVIFCSI